MEMMRRTLGDLPNGKHGIVQEIQGGRSFAMRAAALGFTVGAEVQVIQNLGNGPVMVGVRGARIALGRGEAQQIQVKPE